MALMDHRIKLIFIVITFFFILLTSGCKWVPEPHLINKATFLGEAVTSGVAYSSGVSDFFQLFNVHYSYNNDYYILFLKDHPRYDGIEFMFEAAENSATPLIRVITTDSKGDQIDYVNDALQVKEINLVMGKLKIGRAFEYSPMSFNKGKATDGKDYIHLTFKTRYDEKVEFYLVEDTRPDPNWRMVADPLFHNSLGNLPIMLLESSSFADSRSYLLINGEIYPVPVYIDIPFFFKANRGFHVKGFHLASFNKGEFAIELLEKPFSLMPGEYWIYQTPIGKQIFKIVESSHNKLIISGNTEGTTLSTLVEGDKIGEAIETRKISSREGPREFIVEFNPSLPDLSKAQGIINFKGKFIASVGGIEGVLYGDVIISGEADVHDIALRPIKPEWARIRNVITQIKLIGPNWLFKTWIEQ